jgi:hypothetical protein
MERFSTLRSCATYGIAKSIRDAEAGGLGARGDLPDAQCHADQYGGSGVPNRPNSARAIFAVNPRGAADRSSATDLPAVASVPEAVVSAAVGTNAWSTTYLLFEVKG